MAFSMFHGADPNEVVYDLNIRLYSELSHFMDTNATIKQCVGILDRFLFQSVEILRAKKLLNKYLDIYFLPFFRRMLRYIIILGWCPYHIKKIKDRQSGLPILVPEVFPVDFITCTMVVKKKKMDYEFQFFDEEGTTRRNDIKVFMFSDLTLIANQNLVHSLLSGLLDEYRYLARIKQYTMRSEATRSNPPIYLRRDNAANGVANLADRANGFNGGAQNGNRQVGAVGLINNNPANFDAKEVTASKILEKSTTDMVDNIKFHQNELRDMQMMHQNGMHNASMAFAPQWHNNLFICPPNMILAAPPHLPESRVDQLTIERNLTSQIYLTFGIPETLVGIVGGSSSSIRGSANRSSNIRKDVNIMDVNNFESTLYRYQGFFQDCFTVIYEEIFKKSVDKEMVSFRPPKLYERFIETILEEHGLESKGKVDTEKAPDRDGLDSSGDANKKIDGETKTSQSNKDSSDTEKVSGSTKSDTKSKPDDADTKSKDKDKDAKPKSKDKDKDAKTKSKDKDKDAKPKSKDKDKDADIKSKSKDEDKDDDKDDKGAKTKSKSKDEDKDADIKSKTKDKDKDDGKDAKTKSKSKDEDKDADTKSKTKDKDVDDGKDDKGAKTKSKSKDEDKDADTKSKSKDEDTKSKSKDDKGAKTKSKSNGEGEDTKTNPKKRKKVDEEEAKKKKKSKK